MARAIADQRVNVRGFSAAVIGNKFVAYLGFDSSEDADRAARAFKAVDGAAPGDAGPASPRPCGPDAARNSTRHWPFALAPGRLNSFPESASTDAGRGSHKPLTAAI